MHAEVDQAEEDEGDSNYRDAHDRSGREGDSKGRIEAFTCLGGCADVCANGHEHSGVSSRGGSHGAQNVGDGRSWKISEFALVAETVERILVEDVVVDKHGQYDSDYHYKSRKELVFAA